MHARHSIETHTTPVNPGDLLIEYGTERGIDKLRDRGWRLVDRGPADDHRPLHAGQALESAA